MCASPDLTADSLPPGLTLEQCQQQLQLADLSTAERVHWLRIQGLLLLESGQVEAAIATADQALLLQPDAALIYHLRGIALDRASKLLEAIASFDQALELSLSPTAALWRDRGHTLCSLGRYAPALASYQQALKSNPDDVQALSAQGVLLANLRQSRAATKSCDRALALSPTSAEAWNSRGVLQSVAKQYPEALTCFDQAIALNAGLDRAWCSRGIALLQLEHYRDAIASFDQALQLQPFRVEAWKASAWTDRAYCLLKLGQVHEAITSCDRALDIQPQSYHASLYKVVSLVMAGQLLRQLNRYDTRPQILPLFSTIFQALKYRLVWLVTVLGLLSLGQGMLPALVQHGLSILLSVGMIGLIVTDLWKQRSRFGFVWRTYFHNHWLTYARALATVFVTLLTYSMAEQIAPPYLKWGWANLVFGQPGNIIFQPFHLFDEASMSPADAPVAAVNVADYVASALPTAHPAGSLIETAVQAIASINYEAIFAVGFWLLLLFGIPFWAELEERIFRQGANTWRQIAVRSTQFGLAHLLAGIPILGGLVLILPGFLFACRYKYICDRHLRQGHALVQAQAAGVAASTADHAVYNAILISFAVGTILLF